MLGESHYGDDDGEDLTRRVVQSWAIRETLPFFTKVLRCLLLDPTADVGANAPEDRRDALWQQVCFYNYIQSLLQAPQVPPTQQMWADAAAPFQNVLRHYRPSRVLVLGNRLGDQIQGLGVAPNGWGRDPHSGRVWAQIQHPSSFGWTYAPALDRIRAQFGDEPSLTI